MKLFQLINNYCLAISAASSGSLRKFPGALMSVGRSRIRYSIGPEYHSLYSLHSKPESGWNAYMTDNDGVRVLERLSSPDTHRFLRDKLAFSLHCVRHGMPVATILFRYDLDPCSDYDEVAPKVMSIEEWETALQQAPDEVFCKLIDGRLGKGAFTAERRGHNWLFDDELGSAADLRRYALERLGNGRGWLFQPALKPHPALAEIMAPGALGTLRVTTYLDRNGAQIAFPLLRIPSAGNVVDNFSRGAKGNLVAAIDAESGRLSKAYYSRSRRWPDIATTDLHPDTGKPILGREVPFWEETKALVTAAQELTPEPPTIGWDIAITATGPLIIEANSQYSTALWQVAYDYGMKPDFDRMIESARACRSAHAPS